MIQDGKLRGFAMGHAIPVRTDYTAGEVRRLAQRAKDAAQTRRLLAIAAVLVLGGGLATRPFEAAELWQRGLADKILISQPSEEREVSIGAMPSHSELNREILLKLGVPA